MMMRSTGRDALLPFAVPGEGPCAGRHRQQHVLRIDVAAHLAGLRRRIEQQRDRLLMRSREKALASAPGSKIERTASMSPRLVAISPA